MELTLNRNAFINQLTKAYNFTGNDKIRYRLCGVLLEIQDNAFVRMVATDGHKACMIGNNQAVIDKVHATEDAPVGYTSPEHRLIVSNDTVDRILKNFKSTKCDKDVIVINIDTEKHRGAITITDGIMSITSDLIDGDFPDYTRVVPRFLDKPSSVFFGDLLVSLFKKSKKVKLTDQMRFYITGEEIPSVMVNKDMTELFVIVPSQFPKKSA